MSNKTDDAVRARVSTVPATSTTPASAPEDEGYRKGLKNRQIQMMAIGGAIGTGLFMGAGGRLAQAGPSLIFSYALCGAIAFIIVRALGELVLHRPSSGSFVSYAREFFGEKAAFAAGWLYWLNWAMTSVVDATAVALYMSFFGKYWAGFAEVPQWLYALIALVLVVSLNLLSVKVFGELEFWFALIKVTAIVVFLIVGCVFLIAGSPSNAVGVTLLDQNGGWFPEGVLPAIVLVQGVVFAYAAVELVSTAAGEAKDPQKSIPKAINTVIVRIAVFYVGSILLLSLLLPYSAYQGGESPFVTFFSSVGITGVDAAMNLVVLTAALSSLNAGLYSTGRVLRSMAMAGSAPRFAARMNRAGVPYGGIALTASVGLLGVVLNFFVPEDAFEMVLSIASIGIIASWATIILAHLRFVSWAKAGKLTRPSFRLFGAPYTGYLALLFLLGVIGLMAFDYPGGTVTVASLVVIIPLLIFGWFMCRKCITAIAQERQGFTGSYPIIANRPAPKSSSEPGS